MNPALRMRLLTKADLDFADSLRALAGWNQPRRDWERFLTAEPQGCFLAQWDGVPAGTATTLVYGSELAWIGMLLVHPDFRRRGIGAALIRHSVDYLRRRGVRCIKLDATPLGKTVYDGLGFKDEWTFARWETENCRPREAVDESRIRPWRSEDAKSVDELDSAIFGASRLKMMVALVRDSIFTLVHASSSGAIEGYGVLRVGARAFYLGPVVAKSAPVGRALIVALATRVTGKSIYWDAPDPNASVVELPEQLGFTRQRTLTRMYLGENANPGNPQMQFAIAGPETG